jgi:DNA polymerase (family 10)
MDAKQDSFPLETARGWAEKILAEIEPFCTRAMIVGSIRRERPMVGDIDFVVEPRPGQEEVLRSRIKDGHQVLTDGSLNLIVLAARVQLDFFIAIPSAEDLFDRLPGNWGSLVVCRTGSREFNAWLCNRAKARGMHWNPCRGLLQGGKIFAGETEESIFSALDLPVIPPADREVGLDEISNPVIERFKLNPKGSV